MPNPHIEAGRNALKQADRAARRGDLANAERWSKTAERLAEAAARLANTPEPEEEEAEALRAELLRRIQRLISTEAEIIAWEAERDDYLANVAAGAKLPPLREAPATQADLERIAAGAS